MVTRPRLAVIPARGGSKRIPRKNIIDFHGKPMLTWTVQAALETGLFARVLVSTEDDEIAACAVAAGAEVPFRRTTAFDDHAPVSQVVVDVLRQCREELGEEYETVAQLMANCPLRTAADIADAVTHLEVGPSSFQISCFKFGWMNPWWAVKLTDGKPTAMFPEALKTRSQDLDDLYCPTGAVWVARAPALLEAGTFYGPGHTMHPLPVASAIDIDDYDDLAMAKALFAVRRDDAKR